MKESEGPVAENQRHLILDALWGFALMGIGFGLGTSFGLVFVILTALAVFVLQTYLSRLWLSRFLFGPLEWLWRLLTYGYYIPLKK